MNSQSFILLGLIGIVALLATANRAKAGLSEEDARTQLRAEAMVIDVRTEEEFKAKHLTNVTNIPLAVVQEKVTEVVTNKSQVILLHCRSGRRSGIAEKELRALGYTNAFNIGSYQQAEKILTLSKEK